MLLAPMLSMLALLMPLQGAFQEADKDMITIVEGQNLDLYCRVAAATAGHTKPTLEWKNPKGFVIFFNNYRGLKDRRYKLTHYSMDSLSISLSNVTMQDEGLYTCSHYSETIQRKQVNVLASDKILTVAEGSPRMPTPSPSTETSTMNFNSNNNGSHKILNEREGKFPAWTPSASTEAAMVNSQATDGTNFTYEGIVRNKPRVLLPVLVTVLLAALSIVVLLFVIKLWKAHKEWKKENDVSEQTLESNRSKPNEDNHGKVKNGHVVPWKMSKKYVIRGSCTRMSKNSEGSQDSSVFEKYVPYIIRQTDL